MQVCGSPKVVRNGIAKGQQLHRCKECGHQFFDNGKLPHMRKSKTAVAADLRRTSTARPRRGSVAASTASSA